MKTPLDPDPGEAYRARCGALVGSRDPLAVLEETGPALTAATRGVRAAALGAPEAPGRWSVIEVVEHLADAELVHAYRLRMTLEHDRPLLLGYDPDRWARLGGYAGRAESIEQTIALFARVRERTLRLVRSIPPADLARVGVHARRGEESMRTQILLMAGHDLIHRAQIQRILERVR